MDFDIPADMKAFLAEIDEFIEREIKPLEQENDNIRFLDHRREDARTDWERGGLPNKEWEDLMREARKRADAAGIYRYSYPARLGGMDGTNLGMAVIREHLAAKGLGLHNDLQNEHSIVGNNPFVLMFKEFATNWQYERYADKLLNGQMRTGFGLTEPNHGSDAVMLETRARREGDEYVIDGEKRWIGNASFADVTVIWARDDEDNVGGFLVEKGAPGFSAEVIHGKVSKRAVWQADINLDGVRVPLENRLEHARTFKDTAKVLTATRYGVAWEAIAHAVACYEAALTYAKQRVQFGKPIANFQLIQSKLANMLSEITNMQLMCFRLAQLQEQGKMTGPMASLAKMNNARKAKQVCSDARDILGGNGILLDHHVARHHADMEAIFTFEGTDNIQSLIVGREITGVQAFTRGRSR